MDRINHKLTYNPYKNYNDFLLSSIYKKRKLFRDVPTNRSDLYSLIFSWTTNWVSVVSNYRQYFHKYMYFVSIRKCNFYVLFLSQIHQSFKCNMRPPPLSDQLPEWPFFSWNKYIPTGSKLIWSQSQMNSLHKRPISLK